MMEGGAHRAIEGAISRDEVAQLMLDVRQDLADSMVDLASAMGRSLLEVFYWNGPRAHIPVGALAADGQIFYAADYPEAAAAIEAGKQFVVTEAAWSAGAKSCWSSGGTDSNGRWYRLPKFNGGGGDRATFLRGSAEGGGGQIVGDAIRNITGTAMAVARNSNTGSGAIWAAGGAGNFAVGNTTAQHGDISFDASRVVPTAEENRPYHATVTVCIRMKTFSPNMS